MGSGLIPASRTPRREPSCAAPAALFAGLVVSDPPRGRRWGRWGTLSSALAHAALISAAVLVPLLSPDELPHVDTRRVVIAAVLLAPPPPLVRRAAAAPAPAVRPPSLPAPAPAPPTFTAPLEVPDTVKPEQPPPPGEPQVEAGPEYVDPVEIAVRDSVLDPDVPPRLLRKSVPRFPEEAQARFGPGRVSVLVDVLIGDDGRVLNQRIAPGGSVPALDEAALECVRGWLFSPAQKRGRRVPTRTRVAVVFVILEP